MVLGIVLLMFTPAVAAAAAAVLSKMATVEMQRLLMPYLWFGVGGCTALGLLALMSQAGTDTEGLFVGGRWSRTYPFSSSSPSTLECRSGCRWFASSGPSVVTTETR